jgi:hypothetical protein
LQSAERKRNILSEQCSAALNQQQTAAIDPTREKRGRIEFPIFFLSDLVRPNDVGMRNMAEGAAAVLRPLARR